MEHTAINRYRDRVYDEITVIDVNDVTQKSQALCVYEHIFARQYGIGWSDFNYDYEYHPTDVVVIKKEFSSTTNSVSTSNSVVTSTVKPQAEQSSEPIRITDNSGDAIGSGHGEDAFGVLDHQNPETNADTAGSTDASELPCTAGT